MQVFAGIHLMCALSVLMSLGVAVKLASAQFSITSQRVGKGICTVQFYSARGGPHALPKSIISIHSRHQEPGSPASIGNRCRANTLLGSIASASLASRIA
jgi:hypothetical protein